jgi:Galactose oxidase, central domain
MGSVSDRFAPRDRNSRVHSLAADKASVQSPPRLIRRPAAPEHPLSVPPPCEQFDLQVNDLTQELDGLQAGLSNAAGGEKSAIAGKIRRLTSQLARATSDLDQCLASYPPPDGTVLKGHEKPEVFVVYGAAKFWIPSQAELDQYYGGWGNVQRVRQRIVDRMSQRPVDMTLLRERSDPRVYFVAQGRTRWIPDPLTFNELGLDWGLIRVVPDGSLARNQIPAGPNLPAAPSNPVGRSVGLGGGGAMFAPAISPWLPNLMFLSCDMGGLYKSTDSGQQWHMLDGRDMRGSTRCRVAFHPNGVQFPDTVYAFAKGRDIRISADRGQTWGPRIPAPGNLGDPNLPPTATVTALALDPNPPSSPTAPWRLYVGTSTNGAFYSDDYLSASPTWVAVGPAGQDIVDLVFVRDAGASSRFLYFVATRNGVYHLDGSGNWTPLGTLPSPTTIRSLSGGSDSASNRVGLYVVLPSAPDASNSYLGSGGVYACIQSGGSSWTSVNWVPVNNPNLDTSKQLADSDASCQNLTQYHWVSAVPSSPGHVYVTACGTAFKPVAYAPGSPKPPSHHSGVYRSQDWGQTWEHVYYYVDKRWLGPPPDPVLSDANVGGGWVDWDASWGSGGPAQTPDVAPEWHGGFCVGQQNGVDCAIFANDQACYATFDAGSSWQEVYTAPAAAAAPSAAWQSVGLEVTTTWNYYIDPHDAQSHYLCYTDIGIAHSTDGGKTWFHNGDAFSGTYPMHNAYEIAFDPAIPKWVWVAGARQHDIPHFTELAGFRDSQTNNWYDIQSAGAVLTSADGGQTWSDLTSANPGNGLPRMAVPNSAVAVVPPVVSIVVDQIFRYPAADWRNRRVWASLFGAGVYYSADGGQTWQKRSTGLPNDNQHVCRLEFRPDGTYDLSDNVTPNGLLYCAVVGKTDQANVSHSSGLYLSADRGLTWTNITPVSAFQPALQNPNILVALTDYAIHPTNPSEAYICTDSPNNQGGVYRGTVSGGDWTWTRVMDASTVGGADWPWLGAFAPFYDPSDPNAQSLVVGTQTHGFWRTGDAGTSWQPFSADIPFLSAHRVTFDPANPANRYLTTFGGGAWTESAAAPPPPRTWEKIPTTTSPPGRSSSVMESDGGKLVLFGGYSNGTILGDTWIWDGQSWTNITSSLGSTPLARQGAVISRDPLRGNLVLFSGSGSVSALDDTWTWGSGAWTQLSPGNHPPGRVDATMAFDGTRLILFGGGTWGTTIVNDTWGWNGQAWTQLQPISSPPPRRLAAMCYDAGRGQVVLFGGNDDTNSLSALGDTWLWNGTNWVQATTTGPAPRFGAVMAYDAARNVVVLSGGENSQGGPVDTWLWDGTKWTQDAPTLGAPSTLYGLLAYSPNNRALLLYGGLGPGGVYWTDTWLYI